MEESLAFPSWLDLPQPLSELVLERLPLVDYIRFAAVCPKWRSIQRCHRLRHAPHPPPMANQLPWLIPPLLNRHGGLDCYSPLDRKSYRLPIPRNLRYTRCLASCHGWLLLLDDMNYASTPTSKRPIFLFNPITAAQIPLPPLLVGPESRVVGVMSTTPKDPDCVVLVVFDRRAFLYRLNGHCAADDWTIIQLTALPQKDFAGSAIYCGCKFYYSYDDACDLYVIDPFLREATSQLVMRYHVASMDVNFVFLQEIGGELFSVQTLSGPGNIRQFRVFKADLSGQEWVRVETLGDHVLFHSITRSVFSLPADVDCKRNSIYAPKEIWRGGKPGYNSFTWGVFDLGDGCWTEEETLTERYFGPWFLPALDFVNPANPVADFSSGDHTVRFL